MADRLTGMDVFVRAIRLGGISAAARDLHMSPAMAAKHLDALEARLGTTLIQRSTRRLSLTEAGTDYFEKAERILMEIGEAEAEASSRSITAQGLLRVSAPATFGVLHLASLIPAFSARHPEVTIELGFNDRYVDLLEERWDVAVRIGRLANSALVARKLVAMRVVLCAAPSYLARRGTPGRSRRSRLPGPHQRVACRNDIVGVRQRRDDQGADLRIDVFRQWRGLGSRCHRGPRAGLWATLYCGRGASRRPIERA